MDNDVMHRLSYGLFVLTAREGDKDNGCIVNTVMQVTSVPNQIVVGVNKANYTHDMIVNTGLFNLSILTEKSSFDTYKHWGFQSGKNVDKIEKITYERSENNLIYLTGETNAFLSAEVKKTINMGSHTLFIAEVTDGKMLSKEASVTYNYYQNHIKENPKTSEVKKGYICTVCGYIYEGETLPEDFICPWCKHPAEDFRKL
ncbi:MAG: flavin reductase [Lachnospiraceae bacterium]|nr:flavin reductase [Lachnospiraceae bacterium]